MSPTEWWLLAVGGFVFTFIVGYRLGHDDKAREAAKAIRSNQALCCNCGAVLPFLADGDLYRCSSCFIGSELPAIRRRITTAKPPPDSADS